MEEMLKRYWQQWSLRERVLVLLALACCVFYIGYALLYAPLTAAVENKKAQLREDRATRQWMQNVRQQYQQNKTSAQLLTNGQLLTALGQQLNQTTFHQFAYQLEQTSGGDIQLSFEAVPYNSFLLWFRQLSQQYAFSIKQFVVERTKTPGVVKLIVVLTV